MLKKHSSSKICLIEGSVIAFSLLWYSLNKSLSKGVTPEFIINLTFLILLIFLVIFRNSSIRHMYSGFTLLILTVISDILGYSQFVYLVSSLALGLFILGLINMLFVKSGHNNQ